MSKLLLERMLQRLGRRHASAPPPHVVASLLVMILFLVVGSTYAAPNAGLTALGTAAIEVTDLSTSRWHTCAVLSDGTIKCWGMNGSGQLGDGTTTNRSTPVLVSGITTATQVSAGTEHTCARLADSTLKCWGWNQYGQLGNGTTTDSTTPVAVSGVTNATEVEAGQPHSCALLSGGTVKCWGAGGLLGDGTTTDSAIPVVVSGITTAMQITVGRGHACARLSDSTLKCWGGNFYGQLGDGTTTNALTPVGVSGITTATQVDAGGDHTCTRLVDSTLKCWGAGLHGQLGDGTATSRPTPVSVSGITTATQVTGGELHSCARLADATLKCWGRNDKGQLGDGTTTVRTTPVAVSGITTGTDVTAGDWHSCARLSDSTLMCWGENFDGQLGDGTNVSSLVPVTVLIGGTPSPPLEQSIGTCGAGVHAYSRSACRQGVNTLTGAFTTQVVDLALPGIGVPFTWTRTYTSSDGNVSAGLGRGWTHSFATSLNDLTPPPVRQGGARALQTGDMLLRGDEGQQIVYERQPDGVSFVPASGGLSLLSAVPGGYELVRHDQTVYRFDATGQKLEWMRDRNGQGLTFTFVGNELRTITDSVGRQITVQYQDGRITLVTLPDGRYVEYGYASGLLTSVRDARGYTTLYGYDGSGRLEAITDQRGHLILRNVYDPGTERVSEQDDAFNNRTLFAWDPLTETATMTDARGKPWSDVYSGNLLAERINPLGHRTRFAYDGDLDVTELTDPNGHATTMEYDDRGNLKKRTAPPPFSYVEEWTYNTRNDPLTYKDGRGNVTDYEYNDPNGNLTLVREPDADGPGPLGRPVWVYVRDPSGNGLLKSITDPRAKRTEYSYLSGNLSEIKTQLGYRTTLCYDGSGRMIGLVDPRGTQDCSPTNTHRWSYEYNENDQQERVTGPLGHLTEFGYDEAGNLTYRRDANQHLAIWGHDDGNRVEQVIAPDPDGAGPDPAPVTRYEYDQVWNVQKRIDPKLRETVFAYDDASRLRTRTAPMNRIWTYDYDSNGNLKETVDANGNFTQGDPTDGKTIYGYDQLSRLTSIQYADATPDVTFSYDPNNNRLQTTDGSGPGTSAYDPLNRLTSLTRGTNTFTYAYDLLNLTGRTYPGGTSTSYLYDDDERLQSATSGSLQTNYAYDAAANLQTTTLPAANGYLETRDYDRSGRLTLVENKKGATILSRFAIDPDPVGNPRSVVRTGTSLTQTQTYGYDDMDRLKSVCFQATPCPAGSAAFIGWTYDEVGNRKSETRGAATTTYTYNDADELMTAGSTSYSHDKNGNQLSAGSRAFTWDLANRLKTTTLGSTTTTYTYDGDHKRLQASTGTAASAKTNFLWDVNHALPQIALERNGNNVLQRQYIYGLRRIRQTVGTASYYLYDGLGSVSNLTSASGATQRTWSYEPYGAIRTQSGSSPTNFMQFTGEYQDPTGLYHLRARQYDPLTGRFLSRDPLGSAGSAYAYVGDSPTAFVDPSGERRFPSFCLLLCSNGSPPQVAEKAVHSTLDVVGLFPLLGEPADAINCLWYGGEGDYANAALSCGAIVPGLGVAATGAKLGRRVGAGVGATARGLPNDALVVRGGSNTEEVFLKRQNELDANGLLRNSSVNSAPGRSIEELSQGIPHSRIGVTTAGEIRAAGGTIVRDPLPDSPFHCLVSGISPATACGLFTPTIPNPSRLP